MYDCKEKVVIVTGGASGIGARIVEEFLKEDVKFVAFLDIAENLGIALQNELSTQYGKTKVRFYKCDVTKDEDLFEIYDKIHQEFNGIDVIVNNAGIATETPTTYKKTIETNLTATVSSTYKALELMRVDHGGKGGTIVNVSSTAALYLLAPSIFAYSATKSAILHFSNSIGKEEYFNHTKVRVLTMCFGITESAIWQKMETTDELVKAELVKAKTRKMQSCEAAAKGLIQGYKNGESGSTWLIHHNETTDISDDIKQAFEIMSSKIKIINT